MYQSFCRIYGENDTALRANTEGDVRVEDDVASFRSRQTNKAAGKVRSRFGASRLQDGLLSVHRADRRLLSTDVAAGKMEREGRNFLSIIFTNSRRERGTAYSYRCRSGLSADDLLQGNAPI